MSGRHQDTCDYSCIMPEDYAATNEGHFRLNRELVEKYVETYGCKEGEENNGLYVLDLGSGTGETTEALAMGRLGNLGKPRYTKGIDKAFPMVNYSSNKCKSRISEDNLCFERVDLSDPDEFSTRNSGKFDLVTSFTVLHWIPDHPTVARLVNKVLVQGGRFLFMILGGGIKYHGMPGRTVLEEMKKEPAWENILKDVRLKPLNVRYTNLSWATSGTIDDLGYGHLSCSDYKKMMEGHGFNVDYAETKLVKYFYSEDTFFDLMDSMVFGGFHELVGEEKERFLKEYKKRVLAEYELVDGFYTLEMDVIQIMGQKTQDFENLKKMNEKPDTIPDIFKSRELETKMRNSMVHEDVSERQSIGL